MNPSPQPSPADGHRAVVLLGPQRENPGVAKAVADLGVVGPLAFVTAGWEERESEDDELVRELATSEAAASGGVDGAVNLALFPRADEVYAHHPALQQLMVQRERRRRQLRDLYHLRLAPQLEVCRQLLNRIEPAQLNDIGSDGLHGPEIDHAISVVRELDRHHLQRITELEHEVAQQLSGGELGDHPALVHHRRQVADLVADSSALLIAGGHVGTLISLLRLFDVMNLAVDKPVVAWSAGAMAIGAQVVLFHDSPARGAGDAEVFGPGFNLIPGIIPMPHACHRLALDQARRVALMARRFDPLVCVGLDYTGRVDHRDATQSTTSADTDRLTERAWDLSGQTSVLRPTGVVLTTGTDLSTDTAVTVDEQPLVATDSGTEVESLVMAARTGPDELSRVLEATTIPIVGDGWALFVYRGNADSVKLHHWVSGLPSSQPFRPVAGTDLWTLVSDLQRRARVEYKFEVTRGQHHELICDPLNPTEAHDPFGSNSVASGPDYRRPEWADDHPSTRRGTIVEHQVDSSAFGETRPYSVYLPARFRPQRRYPLLVVHDGLDYVQYASLTTVLDNLIHRLEIPPVIAALTQSPNRLVEYGANPVHGRFVVDDLVPDLESRYRLADRSGRVLLGASFGAVAGLHAAWSRPDMFAKLLLQSGSFAFTDVGSHDLGPVFDPVVEFMNAFRHNPGRPAESIFLSAGIYESLIYFNRSLLPVLQGTGAKVRMVEAADGHNWENWRDHLREGLTWLLPGPQWLIYE